MANLSEILAQYNRLRSSNATRDQAMRDVTAVRQGNIASVFPDLFPEGGPLQDKALAANMVDIAARDTAEVLAPLPTIKCSSGSTAKDKARKFANKRTKIVNNYVQHSQLQRQMYNAADQYVTHGFSVGIVEIDWDNQMPYINLLDPMGSYILKDRFNRITAYFQTMWHDVDTLCAMYPQLERAITTRASGSTRVEVIRYHDKDADVLFMWQQQGLELARMANPTGKVLVVDASRPGLTDNPRGQFDDVLAIQVAKSRFALLAMEAAVKAVQAPIALPQDVQELTIGADATLRSSSPEKIRRIGLDVPRETFMEQSQLDGELRAGSRYPETRTGEVGGSTVTGAGVDALNGAFDTQVRTGQAMFALMIQRLLELCFLVDETVWPNKEKTIRGNENGTPFEISYVPSKDIAGDHSVTVTYGLMAGLKPNQALVFGLQARGDKLISREFMREQLPFNLDPSDEEMKVTREELRDALTGALTSYAQAIPALAAQGQDVGQILVRIAGVIEALPTDSAIERLILDAFKPDTPPPGLASPDAAGDPNAQGAAPGGGDQLPPGMSPDGSMQGVVPGQIGQGGRPDVANLLAGLTGSGQPNLQANVQRRQPI